jgi:predicted transcriptional regulator
MPKTSPAALSKRERQIMDLLYRLGRGTASEIRDRLPGTPSDSTVRTQLRVLEEKGHVRHEEVGLRYVYLPTVSRQTARRAALRHLVDTFFEGSTAKIVTTLLDSEASRLSDDELDRIAALIAAARKESR